MEEVEVGLEKDISQVTSGGMIEAVLHQDQVLGQVPIEIELDVSNVSNCCVM